MTQPSSRLATSNRDRYHQQTRSTLRFAFWEGSTGLTALSLAESFFSPLAIALGGTPFQIGLLSAIPQLGASLGQLATHRFVAWFHSRRRMILAVVAASALPWLAVALLPQLNLANPVAWLIPLATAILLLHNFPTPAWGSWLADIVPLRRRGNYLGLRAAAAGLFSSAVVLASAFVLDATANRLLLGFTVIFLVAMLIRLFSLLLFSRMHEPPQRRGAQGPNLIDFTRSMGQTNLGRLILFIGLLYFGVYFAGPFFSIFMLRNLGFSYTTFILLQTAHVLATIVGSRLWGLYADRHGNVAVLRITGAGICILPFMWLISQQIPFLVMLNVIGGLSWGGFVLCSLNFVYQAVPSGARTRAVGYFNAFVGIGLFLGAVAGGLAASHLPTIFAYQIMTLFLISGIIRVIAAVFILPLVKETRPLASRPAPSLTWVRVPRRAIARAISGTALLTRPLDWAHITHRSTARAANGTPPTLEPAPASSDNGASPALAVAPADHNDGVASPPEPAPTAHPNGAPPTLEVAHPFNSNGSSPQPLS